MRRRWRLLLVALSLACVWMLAGVAQRGAAPPQRPGHEPPDVVRLPNGWRIAPAGRHLYVGDLPLAMVPTPDGRYVVITNNGWSRPTLTVADPGNLIVRSRATVDHAWLGLAWSPDGNRLYSSAAGQNAIAILNYADGRLTPGGHVDLPAPALPAGAPRAFLGGLAIAQDGRTLYAVDVFGKGVLSIDLERYALRRRVELSAEPYTAVISPDGRTLYVSLWGGARVLMFDASTLESRGAIEVGEHPNAMTATKDGSRLFVACANTNAVWVVETASAKASEQISVALYPEAPPGTTPNAVALSPDGTRLLVANADNNTVAVVDVRRPGTSVVEGFIPTGWYPTGASFDRDGRHILILSGKGLASQANPRGAQPGVPSTESNYIAGLLTGTLSVLPVPDAAALRVLTRRVYDLTPYSDAHRLAPAEAPVGSPIPARVGRPSPIKHVFYIIRENRTYDQVLGDLREGNGDPTITLFGEQVTPNAHAIARDFVLFDNFYVDAEVSYDGHAFSTGAYATDVIEKIWPTNYGGRGGVYLSEGGFGIRNPYGNLSAPPKGYIWDFAKRAGVSVRSYGEFADWSRRGGPVTASVPGLVGLVHPSYPPWDLDIPDNDRVDVWLQEFHEFEKSGQLPRLSILRLGGDHTNGTRAGSRTPRAYVAENDLALGRVVEAISRSRFWKEAAVFVLEDDAQNGPDHVDAHRSVLLVASPFARRRTVDHTLYTTSGVLRTMELILGLPPMSQYDAAARPMYAAFQGTPALDPYVLRPARVSLTERNGENAPGAAASLRMNLAQADMAPELELNEIVWQSIHGAGSRMPPPVRSAFIRPLRRLGADPDDDDDDK